jgi:hypothetical protein
VKAAAVARGTITGERPPGFPDGTVVVRVPGTFVMYGAELGCYYLRAHVPAGCTESPGPDRTIRETSTYVGGFPPLYYAATGLPSLVSTAPLARRVMRGTSALLSAVLLGLGLSAAATWSRSRWMVVGAALTVTPTAVYLASVLNPNGLEISAAVAAWTAGTVLVFERADDPPWALVAAFVGSSSVLALTRPLSALWVAGIIVALVAIRPAAVPRLLRERAVCVGLVLTAIVAAGSAVYVVVADSLAIERFPLPDGLSDLQVAAVFLGRLPLHVRSIVGQFGAPEFTAPAVALAIWVVGVGALVCVALCVGDRRQAVVLGLMVVGTLVVIPFGASFPDGRSKGLVWQGRYQYPAAGGIPILAAAVLAATRTRLGRSGTLAVVAVAMGHLVTFYWVLRRYTVGLGPFVNPFASVPEGWEPPVPAPLLAVLVTLSVAAYGAWLLVCLARRPAGAEAAPPGPE